MGQTGMNSHEPSFLSRTSNVTSEWSRTRLRRVTDVAPYAHVRGSSDHQQLPLSAVHAAVIICSEIPKRCLDILCRPLSKDLPLLPAPRCSFKLRRFAVRP